METSYKVTSAAHETPDEEDQDMTAHERHTEPERELRASAQFSSIMVWGHDDPPRPYEHHLFKTVNSWVKLSKAVGSNFFVLASGIASIQLILISRYSSYTHILIRRSKPVHKLIAIYFSPTYRKDTRVTKTDSMHPTHSQTKEKSILDYSDLYFE